MIANYHTHTPRCHHAVGDERDYIENAIRAGLKVLGFADHAPQLFDDGFVSGIRMRPEEAEEYVTKLRKLGEEYKEDIAVYVGFEAEYFPALFPALRQFGRDLGVDYLILGQHCLTDEREGLWVTRHTADRARLTLYVDQLLEGLSTGAFTYLAHPDMYAFDGDETAFREEMTRLCQGAKAMGVPVEVNMLGMTARRHYPTERFYRIAAEVGNEVIVGCDAHDPAALMDLESQRNVRRFAEELGCRIIDTVSFRPL